MAFTFNGVSTDNLSAIKKPSGFTDPSVTPVSGDEIWQWPNTITVDRSTVYKPSRAATLEEILDHTTDGLNKQCEDIAKQLENTTNTVEAYAVLVDVNINLDPNDPSSEFYLNEDDEYVCPVIIYAKVTV